MTKSELITTLYKNTRYFSATDVESAVNLIVSQLNAAITSGERVEIRSFGSFSLRERKSRIGRNPRTGAAVKLGKRHSIHFKPGIKLRERVNNNFVSLK